MEKLFIGGFGCLFILGIVLIFGALGAAILMVLWNWLMPYLFGLPEISFWMAWGICVLLALVGGFFRSSVSANT